MRPSSAPSAVVRASTRVLQFETLSTYFFEFCARSLGFEPTAKNAESFAYSRRALATAIPGLLPFFSGLFRGFPFIYRLLKNRACSSWALLHFFRSFPCGIFPSFSVRASEVGIDLRFFPPVYFFSFVSNGGCCKASRRCFLPMNGLLRRSSPLLKDISELYRVFTVCPLSFSNGFWTRRFVRSSFRSISRWSGGVLPLRLHF